MIDIRNITKEFDGNPVLTGVTETIRKGGFAIIGPSGQENHIAENFDSSKPTSGEVLLEGKSSPMFRD